MTYTNIAYTCEDDIAVITFNRPKALNALNAELLGRIAPGKRQPARRWTAWKTMPRRGF